MTTPNQASLKDSSFARGLQMGLPVFLGYFPVGMAFGILALHQGFTPFQAVLCSALALAGAGQFIALSVMAAGGGVLTTLFATGIVNLRYILFAAALSPYLRKVKALRLSFLGFTLTDETFAINIADHRAKRATPTSMAGVGLISWTGWVLGTLVGVLSSHLVSDPSKFGLEFAMAAMFSALFITLAESRSHVITGVISAFIVLGLAWLEAAGVGVSQNFFIVIASLLGATIATFIFKDEPVGLDEAEISVAPESDGPRGGERS